MDIERLLKSFIEDIWTNLDRCDYFIDDVFPNYVEIPADEKHEKIIEKRIFYKSLRSDVKTKLIQHDFNIYPIHLSGLADYLVNFMHSMCDDKVEIIRSRLKLTHILDNYPPHDSILQTLRENKPNETNEISNDTYNKYLKDRKLEADNIHEIFKFLLGLEDVESLREYLQLVQRNVKIEKSGRFGYTAKLMAGTPANFKDVISPNLDEVVVIPKLENIKFDTTIETNCIKMLIPNQDVNLQQLPVGIVTDVTNSSVRFKIADTPNSLKNVKTVDLIFRSQRLPLRYQCRALMLLPKNCDLRKYLFPKENIRKATANISNFSFQLINADIAENPEQFEAVKNIAAGANPFAPYIVFGPPGTGKTTTIVEAILQLRLQHAGSRILVTAGSNSACDTIALRICQYFKSSQFLHKHFAKTSVLPMLRIYSKSIVSRGYEDLSADLIKRSNIKWYMDKHAYPAIEDIKNYGIIIATLCTVGKLVCADVSLDDFFTHVFIDEAGASSEPKTLVGIMGIKNSNLSNCRIILSGDHKQLGPVLKSNKAENLGLGKSLMQRLLEFDCYAVDGNGNYDHSLQTRLLRNYRSHPDIVGLYNSLYYNNELLAVLSNRENSEIFRKWSFLPNKDFPIVFQAVHGVTTKEETTSSCNMLEVQVLFWYLKRLTEVDKVKKTDIGVIAPYKLQCQTIKNRLKNTIWSDIEVGSVENFQGREKPIIIVLMTRSFAALGFLRSPRRLNVMLSRPKSLLIIMGNPVTLRYIKDIKFIIKTCKLMGTYLRKKKTRKITYKSQPYICDVLSESSSEDENCSSDDEAELNVMKIIQKVNNSKPKTIQLNNDNERNILKAKENLINLKEKKPKVLAIKKESNSEVKTQILQRKPLQNLEIIAKQTNEQTVHNKLEERKISKAVRRLSFGTPELEILEFEKTYNNENIAKQTNEQTLHNKLEERKISKAVRRLSFGTPELEILEFEKTYNNENIAKQTNEQTLHNKLEERKILKAVRRLSVGTPELEILEFEKIFNNKNIKIKSLPLKSSEIIKEEVLNESQLNFSSTMIEDFSNTSEIAFKKIEECKKIARNINNLMLSQQEILHDVKNRIDKVALEINKLALVNTKSNKENEK